MLKSNSPRDLQYLRGNILNLLNLAVQGEALNPDDPTRMGRTVLVQTMENLAILPSNEKLRGALRYLEGKGYIAVEWDRDGSGDFAAIRLLPAGIDLVEGSISDPGVKFAIRR
jgi:hypothetical protein